jgi:ribokinase
LAGHRFYLDFGGKGANQAVAAARLGAHVSLVARLGNDTFGQQSQLHYQAEGLDLQHVHLDGERATGVAAIVVDDEAQNCILVVPGANLGLSPQDVRQAQETIGASASVLCQLEVPLEATLEACRIARMAHVRTILNPSPAVPLPDELLHLTDLCVLNETEIELLTGRPMASGSDEETALRLLQQRGPRAVALTLGPRGCLLLNGDELTHVQARAVQAVDPTGAGDAFTGSLAVYWAEGLSLAAAAARASAVAALTVTRPGAQAAFPTRAELQALLA